MNDEPPAPTTVLDLFERACAATPEAIALEIPPASDDRRTVRYAQLHAMADHIAEALRGAGGDRCVPDAVVGIALPRTDPWLYASILGAMRAGVAYVAIDPVFPAKQAAAILADSNAFALIARPERARGFAEIAPNPPLVEPPPPSACPEAGSAVAAATPAPRPDALAYVIYTSGTTGKPKGVEIEHRSLLNLVDGDRLAFGLGVGDRVAQGSSAAYDSSVEEMWLAWAAGATVVVMDDDTARLGPDLLPWLFAERITVLCPPPTLLRTLACDDPERALPELRLLYVGGEALPDDLAREWSRGRRLENGYGPTECTVTCLRATIVGGAPVTIGTAIPGSSAFVIDPDDADLRTVADGTQGELVVGGASLARGYRNQPETTAARFVEHPELGRVYRTGDLVHRDVFGNFHYHGRIDAQVKLRGYRVELGAVEARLAAHPSVREAACTVEGEGARRQLVAHAVAEPGAVIDEAELRAFVGDTLPPYMVPAAIAGIATIPRTLGGKIDRKRLPAIARTGARPRSASASPRTATEAAVASAIAAALGTGTAIPIEADLFDELGLDSLTAAIAVSTLRREHRAAAATVRMAYQHRTVAGLAAAIDQAVDREPSRAASDTREAVGVAWPRTVATLQALSILLSVVVGAQLLWIPTLGTAIALWLDDPLGYAPFAALVAAAFTLGYALLATGLAMLAKWTLIGRYRPMRVRAWSFWYLRHWIVTRAAASIPWDLYELIGVAPFVLRLLGARVGRGVHIHRGVRLAGGGWDLITLEDGATVGQDASLRPVALESGCIVIDRVTMRRDATLETRAGLSPGAELGERSILRALSNLRAGAAHAHTVLDGVPAEPVGPAPDIPATAGERSLWFLTPVHLVGLAIASTLLALPWVGCFILFGLHADGSIHEQFFREDSLVPTAEGVLRASGVAISASVASVLLLALLVRMLGKPTEGAHAILTFTATRMSMQSALIEAAGKWLSGTIMWPMWLRLAGTSIGRGCEISTVTDVVPSSVRIGDETFFADGVYLGGPRLHAGTATLEPVVLGRSSFVGNHAVLPAGTAIAEGSLVGISTRADDLPPEANSSWFGHPPFRLPRREVVEMPRSLTHDPTPIRRINRWLWELARFLLPVGPILVALSWFRAMEYANAAQSTATFRLVTLPLGVLAAVSAFCLAILAMKWLLVGRVRAGTHALWSCWCSRWDFLYVAWGMWAAVPLAFLEGTPFIAMYLRAMGCRIGRRALLGHGFAHVVDPDMLRFGDGVTVDALFQAHTFEDRVLKIAPVELRDGCTVGTNTVILYGAVIGEGTIVEPHSVVMKREELDAGARYEGVPTRRVD